MPLNMEFENFWKVILFFETQLLAAIWHATVLIFDIYKIS